MLDKNDEKNVAKKNDDEVASNSKNQEGVTSVESNKTDSSDEAVKEVENSVAESAEKETSKSAGIVVTDYSKLSLEKLVDHFNQLLKEHPAHTIKSEVENIKTAFNKKFGALLAEKKAAFLAEGGNSIDFYFTSPLKTTYNQLLSDYKKQRDDYYNNLEKKLNQNLEKRLLVIENLKALIEDAEPATMYTKFKEIQDSWRAIGPVPKARYNDTWKIYHHHVERFYDLLHLSNDFRDLDFKHNLEEKLKLIERAEALAEVDDINFAAKELQELHKTWKEEIGPVAREMRDETWKKFSAATKKIHDRRHEYYKEMRSQFQEIVDVKLAVIEKIDTYDTSKNQSHKDWQKSINEVEALRQQYFKAGKLPYSKSEEVWQKFKKATKKFNTAKNNFYKQEKSEQQDNLKKKLALVALAESLKDSEEWDETTNEMKKIQADWKKIGHVPRKFSDDIWKRFKAACNYYFDRFHQQKNAISKDQLTIVNAKKELLETLKNIEKIDKDDLLGAMNQWNDLGRLPRKMRHLDGKFNKLIDEKLENLSLDKNEVSMLKFTNVVEGYMADNDVKKLDSEQFFIRKKIDEVVREIQQLENNLSFFTTTSDDNPLVVNVQNKVAEFKEDLALWKQKLSYLKNMDY